LLLVSAFSPLHERAPWQLKADSTAPGTMAG
jgi:hypothetical protein